MNTLVGAGFDTIAASLAWMLWCCGLAPDVWEALRAEADEVLGGPPDNHGSLHLLALLAIGITLALGYRT